MLVNFSTCQFLSSARQPEYFIADQGKEVAFVGRSNAGKSSAINCLTQQKQLARASKIPGRTQLINFFQLQNTPAIRLVDLPGYGFARVNRATKMQWHHLIDHYLRHRLSLQGLVLIMDSRHPLQPFDLQMLDWSKQTPIRMHVLLNKCDKLSRHQALQALAKVQRSTDQAQLSVQLFSAKNKTGLEELGTQISRWLIDQETP